MNSYRKNIRDEARIQNLKELIVESISKLPNLPQVKCPKVTSTGKKKAVLMLSDLHIGVNCDNFYNTYNVDVAAYRLSKLARDTIQYCNEMNVTELNVCNLGDMIHGLIHINARLEQQMDTVEQVMTAAELLSGFLTQLDSQTFRVVYRSCTDNHSRIVADKNQHIEKDNLYRIIDWYLVERLKGTDIEFKFDNLDAGIGMFKLFDRNIVFVHGHEDSIDKMMQNMVGATGQVIDYALMGHFHSEKMKSYQGFKVYVNGSIVGTEQYALSKRLFSRPTQTLLIFQANDRNVIKKWLDRIIRKNDLETKADYLMFEKVFKNAPTNEKVTAQKVLEINTKHEVYNKLLDLYKNDKEGLKNYTKVLYNLSLLINGLTPEDPNELTDLICKIISK